MAGGSDLPAWKLSPCDPEPCPTFACWDAFEVGCLTCTAQRVDLLDTAVGETAGRMVHLGAAVGSRLICLLLAAAAAAFVCVEC